MLLVVGAGQHDVGRGPRGPVGVDDGTQLGDEDLAGEVLAVHPERADTPLVADGAQGGGEDVGPGGDEVVVAQRPAVEPGEGCTVEVERCLGDGLDDLGAVVGAAPRRHRRVGHEALDAQPILRHRQHDTGGRLGGDAAGGELAHDVDPAHVVAVVAPVAALRPLGGTDTVAAVPGTQGGRRDGELVGDRPDGPLEVGAELVGGVERGVLGGVAALRPAVVHGAPFLELAASKVAAGRSIGSTSAAVVVARRARGRERRHHPRALPSRFTINLVQKCCTLTQFCIGCEALHTTWGTT